MKAIECPIIITSIRSRQDGSLGFSAETPELTKEEKVNFMDLQGLNVKALLNPADVQIWDIVQVKSEPEVKSQSQRLRAIIAVTMKKLGKPEDSDRVYYNEMEALINKYKDKLDKLPE